MTSSFDWPEALASLVPEGVTPVMAVTEERREATGTGLIGWVEGRSDGPLLLCIGGVHGNEPAGVQALEEMVKWILPRKDAMAGDFVAIVGNQHALAAGRRFVAYDFNRAWTPDRVRTVEARRRTDARRRYRDWARGPIKPRLTGPEDHEMYRVLGLLERVAERRRGPVYVLDLHTTSGKGGTFTSADDRPRHRRFAMKVPFPLVLGLDDHLEGTLLGHLNTLGYTTMLCECGQHGEEQAASRAVAATWIAIRAAGLLDDGDIPEARRSHRMLRGTCAHLPRVLETVYRHPFDEADRYVTRPGFRNFHPIRAGDVVGDDRNGEVVAPKDGLLLMPLYQELGEDGFFVVREVEGPREPG